MMLIYILFCIQDIEDLTVTSRRKQLPEAQEAYTKAKADFEAFLKAI